MIVSCKCYEETSKHTPLLTEKRTCQRKSPKTSHNQEREVRIACREIKEIRYRRNNPAPFVYKLNITPKIFTAK